MNYYGTYNSNSKATEYTKLSFYPDSTTNPSGNPHRRESSTFRRKSASKRFHHRQRSTHKGPTLYSSVTSKLSDRSTHHHCCLRQSEAYLPVWAARKRAVLHTGRDSSSRAYPACRGGPRIRQLLGRCLQRKGSLRHPTGPLLHQTHRNDTPRVFKEKRHSNTKKKHQGPCPCELVVTVRVFRSNGATAPLAVSF